MTDVGTKRAGSPADRESLVRVGSTRRCDSRQNATRRSRRRRTIEAAASAKRLRRASRHRFWKESLQGIRRGIEEIRADIQKLTAANLVTAPPVITAATLTLNEETVERAVARALAKARLTIGNNGEVEGSGT